MPQASPQADPRLNQWQYRFDAVNRALSEGKRQGESAADYQTRQQQLVQALRELQTNKPTGSASTGGPQGQPNQPTPQQQQQQAPASGGMLGGLYDYIARAMGGAGQ
ncbi:hypothetical protein [Novosphingobium clariflavum]|uniref:Uncharacterized protein n=1 Tax=Novosphingobium clariflavum TaxID=2029884 RepID=A0ABV6SB25_9SPHN|nr:hypothetical protein [Novosphingobium clariflavum]